MSRPRTCAGGGQGDLSDAEQKRAGCPSNRAAEASAIPGLTLDTARRWRPLRRAAAIPGGWTRRYLAGYSDDFGFDFHHVEGSPVATTRKRQKFHGTKR